MGFNQLDAQSTKVVFPFAHDANILYQNVSETLLLKKTINDNP